MHVYEGQVTGHITYIHHKAMTASAWIPVHATNLSGNAKLFAPK